jgi:hypothetical protein
MHSGALALTVAYRPKADINQHLRPAGLLISIGSNRR